MGHKSIDLQLEQWKKIEELARGLRCSPDDIASAATDEYYSMHANGKSCSTPFRAKVSLEELQQQQGVTPVSDISDLPGEHFEEEEDFEVTLRRWREEGSGSD